MSEWAMKRFWTDVSVEEEANGFTVRLDGRPVRTPAKRHLIAPNEAVAQKIAAEWNAQAEKVDTTTMPWTRTTNAAIDKVATQRPEVAAHLASYAGTDLVCYRADGPESLIERQNQSWDPIIAWVKSTYEVALMVTQGVMPVEQDDNGLASLASAMDPMTDFQLTGFHDLVTLTGSYSLGLAAAQSFRTAHEIWAASRIDEEWQIEQWGEDEEAQEHESTKKQAFLHATEVFKIGA